MTGIDGMSNCDNLCNPANHYEWSCKKYCPGYVLRPTFTISRGTIAASTDATPNSNFNSALPVILASLIASGIVITVICILYKKRVTSKFCPVNNKTLANPIQETETVKTLFRYENELNERKEHDRVIEADTTTTVTDNHGDEDPLLQPTLHNSNTFNGIDATTRGNCNGKNTYKEEFENQAACNRRPCIEMNEISRNEGQNQQTGSVDKLVSDICDIDSDASSSEDDITVKDDSSDEESITVEVCDDKRPKRVVRVVTEIEV